MTETVKITIYDAVEMMESMPEKYRMAVREKGQGAPIQYAKQWKTGDEAIISVDYLDVVRFYPAPAPSISHERFEKQDIALATRVRSAMDKIDYGFK